jgi:hypothetical protein
VVRVRRRYPEWWLVFSDCISFGDWNESEREQLRKLVQVNDSWDKIILVNPHNHAEAFEI